MMIFGLILSFLALTAVLLWCALPRLLGPAEGIADWNRRY
jgi:hypothetical protein